LPKRHAPITEGRGCFNALERKGRRAVEDCFCWGKKRGYGWSVQITVGKKEDKMAPICSRKKRGGDQGWARPRGEGGKAIKNILLREKGGERKSTQLPVIGGTGSPQKRPPPLEKKGKERRACTICDRRKGGGTSYYPEGGGERPVLPF